MGIWEALKRASQQVSGRTDPEGNLYRIDTVRSGLPDDGDVVFDVIASSPAQTVPGAEYYKDADGKLAWKWIRNTAGVMPVAVVSTEGGATDVGIQALRMAARSQPATVVDLFLPTSDTHAKRGHRRVGVLEVTLSGGVATNQVMVAALAGYYGVLRPLALVADQGTTYTLAFQDDDDNALRGGAVGISVTTTAGVPYEFPPGMVMYAESGGEGVDNKVLEVDISGGVGADNVILYYEYWYET